jgi:hypothetical protein
MFEIWLVNLRQESWREPFAKVSERATNNNSAREIEVFVDTLTLTMECTVYLILKYGSDRPTADACSTWAPDPTSAITIGPYLTKLNSLICISFKVFETDNCIRLFEKNVQKNSSWCRSRYGNDNGIITSLIFCHKNIAGGHYHVQQIVVGPVSRLTKTWMGQYPQLPTITCRPSLMSED